MNNTNEDNYNDTITVLTVLRLDRALLHPSPTNPRKHFAPLQLEELAASIAQKGIKQPLLVRPSREVAGGYEIIAGERRWRAHGMALSLLAQEGDGVGMSRIDEVPCLVEDLDDNEVMELQLIENLQRVDLTPLEEADGYARMLSLRDAETGEAIYTVAKVAEKLGRAVSDIHKALKWSRLPELARECLERGICGKEHATLIGRIPEEMARRRATLEVLIFTESYDEFQSMEELERGEEDARKTLRSELETVQPLTVQAARQHIAEHYMADLSGVAFDVADETLEPVVQDEEGQRMHGGSCMDCPMRTGSSPDLAGELQGAGTAGMSPMVCMHPRCRSMKIAAHAGRQLKQAAEEGAEIISGEKAGKFFYERGREEYHLRQGGEWVALSDKPGYDLLGHVNEGKIKTWEKLLAKLDMPRTALVDPAGGLHWVVDRDKAVLAVNLAAMKAGKPSPFERAMKTQDRPPKVEHSTATNLDESDLLREVEQHREAERDKEAKEKRKEAEKKKLDAATTLQALGMLATAVADGGGLGIEDWYFLIELALPEAGADGVMMMATLLGVKQGRQEKDQSIAAIMEHLRAMERPKNALEGLLVAVLVAQQAKWSGMQSERLKRCMKRWDVTEVEARQLAKDEAKGKGKREKGEGELTTATRSEAIARNEAGHASEQEAQNEVARQEGEEAPSEPVKVKKTKGKRSE